MSLNAGPARPGFSFLVCPDSSLTRARLEQELAAHAAQQWERHVYWGDEEPPPRFWEQLALQGLFGTSRVLVLRQANLWPAAVWKRISQALARPSSQCWPFFCLEGNWERGQPKLPAHLGKLRCLAFADSQGWIWRSEGLTERSLKRHVQQRLRQLGLRFEPDALEQFCASLPPDAQTVENELEKLLLLQRAQGQEGRPIMASMLGASAWSPECNIFACIRQMEAGNLPALWKELTRNRNPDSLLFPLLGLLAREFRLLWQVLVGERVRLHPNEIGSRQQLARKLGAPGLAAGMAAVADAEWQIKSGRRSPEQTLEFLAADLALLFSGKRP